jgi:hypothetical protein
LSIADCRLPIHGLAIAEWRFRLLIDDWDCRSSIADWDWRLGLAIGIGD